MPQPQTTVRRNTVRWIAATILCGSISMCVLASAGCHDGPMYGLKAINPFFAMKQWREDEAIGVTDHHRMKQLQQLARSIDSMPAAKQTMWAGHLRGIYENDPSAEMRRLAMVAAAGLSDQTTSLELIDRGLSDSVAKVRMEACRSLGKRSGDEPARMLVAALNTDTDLDVRQSAIAALKHHPGSIASGSLRQVLEDQDPATRMLAITSLKAVTGQDLGSDPDRWIAMLDTDPSNAPAAQIAARP